MHGTGQIRFGWGAIVIGCLVTYFLFIRPYQLGLEAASWPEVACRVLEVRAVGSEEDTGYELALRLRYEVDGVVYESERYGLYGNLVLDGTDGSAELARLRELDPATCYYDPAAPGEAVLDRTPAGINLFAFIGLGAILIGLVALGDELLMRRRFRGRAKRARHWPEPGSDGRFRLRRIPGDHLITGLGATGLGVLTATLMILALAAVPVEEISVIAVLVVGLVALGFLAVGTSELLGLLGPDVALEIDEPVIALGGSKTVRWRIHGVAPAIREVVVELLAREEAMDPDGELRSRRFHRSLVTRLETNARSGSFEVELPGDVMPSFVAEHHRITWELRMKVDVDWWPDEDVSFALTVGPPEPEPDGDAEPPEAPARSEAPRAPAKEADVRLVLDSPTTLRPGDELAGTIHWSLAEAPVGGELVLRWSSRGPSPVASSESSLEPIVDRGEVCRVELARLASLTGSPGDTMDPYRRGESADLRRALAADDAREFHLRAPASPYSFCGDLFRIEWELAVIVPGQPETVVGLVIAPTRAAIVLEGPSDDSEDDS